MRTDFGSPDEICRDTFRIWHAGTEADWLLGNTLLWSLLYSKLHGPLYGPLYNQL